MPKSPLNLSELLLLDTAAWDESQLVSYFQARPNQQDLDAWLLSPARRGSARGQLLLRSARMAAAYEETDAEVHLLIGLPLSVAQKAPNSVDWATARRELEGGLASALEAQVAAAPAPWRCAALHAEGATRFTAWHKRLFAGTAALPEGAELDEGAGVWPLAISVAAGRELDLSDWFFRMNPDITRITKVLALRLEGLLEEQGLEARVFPPTALWNSMSIARIAHARLRLQALPDPASWTLAFADGVLSAQQGDVQVTFDMPEELDTDLVPLRNWFQARATR